DDAPPTVPNGGQLNHRPAGRPPPGPAETRRGGGGYCLMMRNEMSTPSRRRFMPRRSVLCLALSCLTVLAATPVRAADAKPSTPTLVVRLEAVDDLLADLKHLAAFADRDDLVTQAEGLLRARGGAKGVEGIDT